VNLSDTAIRKLQKVLRFNMFLGLMVTVISTYLIITGTYDSIQSRQSEETILNLTALFSLFYTFIFWILCVFRNQFFKSNSDSAKIHHSA